VGTSLFDLYKIGVGPSSSHTMGPMRAACRFARELAKSGRLEGVSGRSEIDRVQAELFGSLALTGRGHGTDRAVMLGLSGYEPATIDPAAIDSTIARIRVEKRVEFAGRRSIAPPIAFDEARDLLFRSDQMFPPGAAMQHPNGLRLTAFSANGEIVSQRTFFSIGGGFIVEDGVEESNGNGGQQLAVPYPFMNAAELIDLAEAHGFSISDVMLANERALAGDENGPASPEKIYDGIERLWQAMQACVERGMATEGILPGGLNVRRRAKGLAARLREKEAAGKIGDPLAPLDWVNVYAMAVNEENAAGGRVVTAPTNGAAGVVPAVAHYYQRFVEGPNHEGLSDGLKRFFLTSAAIGILYKMNASISGAEVGCQGEVGVACSMAAAGLAAALGGTNHQVEQAAEIAMEHSLGMTCDPIGGLVQIPCIERNAMGAARAVQSARIALNESGQHKVSLDQVIRTMYLTGLDMQSRYKETSLAGLALNVIEC
jgi:L-serine dehydratase